MKKKKAKMLDAILLKFRGDVSIRHDNQRENRFEEIGGYFEIENLLNLLESDGMIERRIDGTKGLTPRGISTIGDIEDEGYVAKTRKQIFTFERICWILSLILMAGAVWFAARTYFTREMPSMHDESIPVESPMEKGDHSDMKRAKPSAGIDTDTSFKEK
jgi:hypothetical protein